jgi:hypothetical protein
MCCPGVEMTALNKVLLVRGILKECQKARGYELHIRAIDVVFVHLPFLNLFCMCVIMRVYTFYNLKI